MNRGPMEETRSGSEIVAAAKATLLKEAAALLGVPTLEGERTFFDRLGRLLAHSSEEELVGLVQRLEQTGNSWGYHAPNAFARRMHHLMGDVTITPDSELNGLENLIGTRGAPLLFLLNHLSYADANVFEILLVRSGRDDIASRLSVVAGPKVYSELFRRFSSLCFGTIKTPQSSVLSSGEAVMPPREVARVARQTIRVARERLDAGDALLLFVEGTRSRESAMQQTLAAIVRYFEHPELLLVPVGIAGTENLIPVGGTRVHPARLIVSVGRPLKAATLLESTSPRRQLAMDVIGLKIAEQLPPSYRGAYGDDAVELDEARALAAAL
jgi:1-acyl-sn-glycerol-3-phosphate acyltransferase